MSTRNRLSDQVILHSLHFLSEISCTSASADLGGKKPVCSLRFNDPETGFFNLPDSHRDSFLRGLYELHTVQHIESYSTYSTNMGISFAKQFRLDIPYSPLFTILSNTNVGIVTHLCGHLVLLMPSSP